MKTSKLLFVVPLIVLTSFGCKKKNNSSSSGEPIIDINPQFSLESGFYNEDTKLYLESAKGYDIFYTIDGSTPTTNSVLYTNGITLKNISNKDNVISMVDNISNLDIYYPLDKIDKCINLKAIAIDKSGETSEVIEKTYFIGIDNKNLPIVNLSMSYEDLFDYEKGIYVKGKVFDNSPETVYPEQHEANYTQKGKEWERLCKFTYFDGNKDFKFTQDIGVRIHGGWSRAFSQKSFNLYARKEYSGSNSFEIPFFGGKSLKTCMLRSGGYRDTFYTKSRDSLNQDLSKKYKFDTQDSYPVIVFLNGEYWGIYNLQERFSDTYVEEEYGIDKGNVIIVENDEIDEGKDSDISYYNDLREFFQNGDFSIEETYNQVSNYIDIDEFIEYMSTELYVGNIDWPGNNVRLWRSRAVGENSKEDGKWHFMMYDTDDSENMVPSKCSPTSNPFLNSNHWKDGPLDEDCILGLMLSKLLNNDAFKARFKDRIINDIGESFSSENAQTYLTDKTNLLKEPMVKYYNRFVSNDQTIYNQDYFQAEIDKIISFFSLRKSNMISFVDEL